jgi:hypothetical protein
LKQLVDVTVTGDRERTGGTVTATANHPFWLQTTQQWQPAGNLQVGDVLRTGAGSWTQISSIARHTQQATVHNLTVAGHHTFYVLAGGTPILVHNTNNACPPQLILGVNEALGKLVPKVGGGFTYMDPSLARVGPDTPILPGGVPYVQWMQNVVGWLSRNGRTAVSLSKLQKGDETAAQGILRTYKEGYFINLGQDKWFATKWEVYKIGQNVRAGNLDWNHVTWYDESQNVVKVPKIDFPRWDSKAKQWVD